MADNREAEVLTVTLELPLAILREEARVLWLSMFRKEEYGQRPGPAREVLTAMVRREAQAMASSPEILDQVREAIREHFPRVVREEVESALRAEIKKGVQEARKRGELIPALFESQGEGVSK